MKDEKVVRSGIFSKVKQLYELKKGQKKFVPGLSPIPYSGRVYDYREMINLVDSSLEFWLTSGRYAAMFEKKMSEYLGVKYCLLTNSGSSANLLAISVLTSKQLGERRLKPGDEVITTACGFPTTANAIIQNNLIPVFVDVELGNYNIKTEKLVKAVSRKTKAIFIAHTLGNTAKIDVIQKIAKKHGLWFIEDNCDSLGTKYKSRFTGTFGDIATCSFYPPHHITMGEGGAVLTGNSLLRKLILSFRDWGRDCWCDPGRDNTCRKRFSTQYGKLPFGYDHKYVYSHIGYNLKITDMQAAVGVAQMEKLPLFIQKRKKNFSYLMHSLKKHEKYFILPAPARGASPSWFGFPILVKETAPFKRADIVNFLEDNKIATRMLFGGNLIKQPAYEDVKYRVFDSLKNTDMVMNNLFWIGVYPGLNKRMLGYIVKTFDTFIRDYSS